jgi:hypothetical protein
MVDSMKQEMERNGYAIVGEESWFGVNISPFTSKAEVYLRVEMKQKSVEDIFHQRPEEEAQ